MKAKPWNTLVAKYRSGLRDYLAHGDEENLQHAYELGRRALNMGLGVMDMARLHQEALAKLVNKRCPPLATPRWTRTVETFLMETLSAFEVAHRGFRDACDRLQRLNQTLEQRNRELGAINQQLEHEIHERKQAEEALRESREHYIRLFKEARGMEENLRQLSNKILTIQEEERKHISRELHDEIGQALTAVNVSIAMLRAPNADAAFQKRLDAAQRLLLQSMEMVHRFARELRPSMLDHLGPVAALRNYVKAFTARTGIKAELEGAVRVERLNNQQGTVLYRVAQESLTNVFKHANATRVTIRLRQLPRAVSMEIADNGRAFKVPNGTSEPGRQPLGLLGMQERVRLVNGQFAIESVPKRGTTVRVQIPLPEAELAPAQQEASSVAN